MIKTVFFDIDNTLYCFNEGDRLGKEALYDYIQDNFGFDRDKARTEIADAQSRLFDALPDRAAMHNRLIRYQYFLEKFDLPVFPHALNMATIYWKTLLDSAVPEPGIKELMSAIKNAGYRIGIGTNMTSYVQYLKIDKLGLTEYIDYMVTSEEADSEKPSAQFFELVCKKASCSPDEIIFIGDNLECDVKGSQNAGMHSVLYLPKFLKDTADIPSDGVIRSYTDCLTPDGIKLGNILLK